MSIYRNKNHYIYLNLDSSNFINFNDDDQNWECDSDDNLTILIEKDD